MESKLENQEAVPVVETVRVALFHRGKFLILEKDASSRNPGALEFPGGGIDNIKGKTSTEQEQKQTVIEEVQQETGINVEELPIEKVESFGIYYEALEKNGVKKKYRRLIHLFLVRLPDIEDIITKVNKTIDAEGELEDKHENYKWVLPEELINSATSLRENPHTREKVYPLTQNSRHIKELLKTVGYLKFSQSKV